MTVMPPSAMTHLASVRRTTMLRAAQGFGLFAALVLVAVAVMAGA